MIYKFEKTANVLFKTVRYNSNSLVIENIKKISLWKTIEELNEFNFFYLNRWNNYNSFSIEFIFYSDWFPHVDQIEFFYTEFEDIDFKNNINLNNIKKNQIKDDWINLSIQYDNLNIYSVKWENIIKYLIDLV